MRTSTNVQFAILCFLILFSYSAVVGQDNLGNHTATQDLEMSNKNINGVNHLYTKGLTVGEASTSETISMKTDAAAWNLVVRTNEDFTIRDVLGGNLNPFTIQDGTPSNTMFLRNNGQVGIGTSSPSQKLHVKGGSFLIEGTTSAYNIINSANGADGGIFLQELGNNKYGIFADDSKDDDFRIYDYSGNKNILYYDKSNQSLGINTTAPAFPLHVFEDDFGTIAEFRVADGTHNPRLRINGSNEGITLDATYSTGSKNLMFNIAGVERARIKGNNFGIGTSDPAAMMHINSGTLDEAARFESTDLSTNIVIKDATTTSNNALNRRGDNLLLLPQNVGNVGIGTTNPGSEWKLAVNGPIRAKEVKVETGWSDFVFYPDYKLPTLEEVESHIKENGHLKDIPSAKEVEENGVLLGEMDSKLLQKIEELTLYAIERKKEVEETRSEMEEMKKELELMRKQVLELLEKN